MQDSKAGILIILTIIALVAIAVAVILLNAGDNKIDKVIDRVSKRPKNC